MNEALSDGDDLQLRAEMDYGFKESASFAATGYPTCTKDLWRREGEFYSMSA